MWKALLRSGEQVGRSRVERLMRQNGMQGAKRRGKPWRTTSSRSLGAAQPGSGASATSGAGRMSLWFADFTYLRCWEGIVFFSFVIDAYSRRIVGWQFAPTCAPTLVLDALQDGAAPASTRRRRRAGPPQRCRQPIHLDRLHPDARRSRRPRLRSGRSATPTTTPSPRASSTASRPSSSPTASGPARSQLELAVVEYVAWFNNNRLHASPRRPATTRDRGTLRCERAGQPHPSTECWEPTNTVSVKPRTAQTPFDLRHSDPRQTKSPALAGLL